MSFEEQCLIFLLSL